MSQPRNVTISLLDKEYLIACPDDSEAELLASADYLNQKMQEIKSQGKVLGLERIAVMAALNISHELIRKHAEDRQRVEDRLRSLGNKIDQSLEKMQHQDDETPASEKPAENSSS